MKMNKFILVLSLAVLFTAATVCVVAFSPQNEHEGDSSLQSLSAKTETIIKQDYLKSHVKPMYPDATVDNITILKYYGTYGGCVAVLMTDSHTLYAQVLGTEVVGGITIHYSDSNRMLIWKNGNFYHLQEAYKKGLLKKDNLIKISDISSENNGDYW
jgi:hypothetical protein